MVCVGLGELRQEDLAARVSGTPCWSSVSKEVASKNQSPPTPDCLQGMDVIIQQKLFCLCALMAVTAEPSQCHPP